MGTKILAAVSDLIFRTKISGTAALVGAGFEGVTSADALVERAGATRPDLIVVDLADSRFDACEAIRRLKSDPSLREIPVLGYFPHVMAGVREAALEAGCDRVLPRSAFSARLPELLGRKMETR